MSRHPGHGRRRTREREALPVELFAMYVVALYFIAQPENGVSNNAGGAHNLQQTEEEALLSEERGAHSCGRKPRYGLGLKLCSIRPKQQHSYKGRSPWCIYKLLQQSAPVRSVKLPQSLYAADPKQSSQLTLGAHSAFTKPSGCEKSPSRSGNDPTRS